MTDPSMHGTPVGTLAGKYSLAEIDTQCRKATRGAGYSWGLAEEAGKAVRWLSARGLPGPQALAGLLSDHDGKDYAQIKPLHTESCLVAAAGTLCPIITGALLSDQALEYAKASSLSCGAVAWPLLLLPFLARLAEIADIQLETSWSDLEIRLGPKGISMSGPEPTYLTARTEQLIIHSAAHAHALRRVSICNCAVPAPTWQILDKYAARTYAPATEASRLTGAGADTHDLD